jgi:site-specific recombinase XerD
MEYSLPWEWYSQNPITRVRQSAKRSRIPIVLSVAQIQALLDNLREPVRTMVLVDVSTGLRIGDYWLSSGATLILKTSKSR